MENTIDIIKNYFEAGEKVEWSGKPQPYKVNSGCYSKSITTRLVICLVAAIALIIIYIVAANATSSNIGAVGIIICIVVPGFVAIDPYINRRRMLNNSRYVITDKRLYVQVDAKNVRAIPLEKISKVQYVGGENGCGHVIVSTDATQSIIDTQLRNVAMSPKLNDNSALLNPFMEVKTVVLYNIANPENAMGVLHSKAV